VLLGIPSIKRLRFNMVTKRKTTGVKKLHSDERRKAILIGAAKAFVENGYDGTSLDDITREAGISRTLLYRHFDTKKDIYVAILEGEEKPPTPDEIGREEVSLQRTQHLIDLAQSEPDRFRLVFRHAAREPEFRGFFEQRLAQRETFINKLLEPQITDSKKRKFAALMLRDTIIGILLTWTDCGCPNPEIMPSLIGSVIDTIGSAIENS
jgi:AcrR family transcriptional regulator